MDRTRCSLHVRQQLWFLLIGTVSLMLMGGDLRYSKGISAGPDFSASVYEQEERRTEEKSPGNQAVIQPGDENATGKIEANDSETSVVSDSGADMDNEKDSGTEQDVVVDTLNSVIDTKNYTIQDGGEFEISEQSKTATSETEESESTTDSKNLSKFGTDEGFAVCLIYMDDNHFLPEWLAYHYQILPLRRLIVGIDPKSTTSPIDILNRYYSRGLINITIWHDDDYFPHRDALLNQVKARNNMESDEQALMPVYLWRQQYFYKECMQTLRAENRTWVGIFDTDEFVTRNPYATEDVSIQNVYPTVKQMLDDLVNRNASESLNLPCLPMSRPEFAGHLELHDFNETHRPHTDRAISSLGPRGKRDQSQNCDMNVTRDFLTYRWRAKHNTLRPGKAMIDVSRIGDNDIPVSEVNPHRPIKSLCTQDDIWARHHETAFITHHYTGTFEQWTSRNDSRSVRNQEGWDKMNKDIQPREDDVHPIREWLPKFVSSVGRKTAKRLLQGAGITNATASSCGDANVM